MGDQAGIVGAAMLASRLSHQASNLQGVTYIEPRLA